MNTFKKIRVEVMAAVSLGVLALGSVAAPAQAATPFALATEQLSLATAQATTQATSQIAGQIAAELKATFAQLANEPRPARGARTASVFITETNAIVVEATRLPRVDSLAATERTVRTAL
ncbi:MAG TPA: hypothetical protein VGN07_13130 [Steroidobacteraceae bacterium]|jgi:hypothetical protein